MVEISKTKREELVPNPFPIVALGASAGGIQALTHFFSELNTDSGMAYLIMLHLSPADNEKLAQSIGEVTTIPLFRVTKAESIQPDCIYIIPADQHLELVDECIAPAPILHEEERRAPIDILFRKLAEIYGGRVIAVVLSGTGANGSMGLKRIKEWGGAAFVQNPREAEFNEMPRNAIATDLIDEVLPVREIPARIVAYSKNLGQIHLYLAEASKPEFQQKALREIFMQLRKHTGHDFTNYKRPTLLRRIERRISVHGLPDLKAYAAFIQANVDEVIALLKELLISVTNFFRDKEAFSSIERDVIPNIINNKTGDDQVRIWVAGCATGEEAYSIAMLCVEQLSKMVDAPKIQIFATDIDEQAIAAARDGFYTATDAADVSPERLRRFFTKEGSGYQIRREIREMILFANHNFLKDPPFSHLDMVTCRNVLIYLNHTAQQRVMETFHFALNPGGFLFLGSSESADRFTDLFSSFNREQHIFQAHRRRLRTFRFPNLFPHPSLTISGRWM